MKNSSGLLLPGFLGLEFLNPEILDAVAFSGDQQLDLHSARGGCVYGPNLVRKLDFSGLVSIVIKNFVDKPRWLPVIHGSLALQRN